MGDEQEKTGRNRDAVSVMPAWAIWVGALVLLVVGAAALWLLFRQFGAATAQDEVRIRIVQLAGGIVLGAGGAVGLLLAARKQRSTELGIRQTERDLAIKTQAAEDARQDAIKRRIDELYVAIAGQLDSDKAMVRTAALHTLERLGEDNPGHRQAVVDMLCAYLRMPFVHPEDDTAPSDDRDERRQELEVRRTAQRVLTDHLKPKRDDAGEPSNDQFWPGMSIDLSHAVLDEFNLSRGEVSSAIFDYGHFRGTAVFEYTNFLGQATFEHAAIDDADFSRANFHDSAGFDETYFHDTPTFWRTRFNRFPFFSRTRFRAGADFQGVISENGVNLGGARRRWDDPEKEEDTWPTGWFLRPPKNEEEGRIDGLDGVWGFVIRNMRKVKHKSSPTEPLERHCDEGG